MKDGNTKTFNSSGLLLENSFFDKVTKYKPDDDFSNNHAVLIESLDGKAYFVPLLKSPQMYDMNSISGRLKDGKLEKLKMGVMEGDFISVKTYESQQRRLTPIIFKRDASEMVKDIKRNNYTGVLAEEIKSKKR